MTQQLSFPSSPNDFDFWKSLIEIGIKKFCRRCDDKLDTYRKGHRLHNKVFICYRCGIVYEKEGKGIRAKLVISERLSVM